MTLYEKVGRNYVPVQEEVWPNTWPKGWYLVHVHPGGSMMRLCVKPDYPSLLSAAETARDAMAQAIADAGKETPPKRKMTRRERKAYKAYAAVMGEEEPIIMFHGACPADIADAGVRALMAAVEAGE